MNPPPAAYYAREPEKGFRALNVVFGPPESGVRNSYPLYVPPLSENQYDHLRAARKRRCLWPRFLAYTLLCIGAIYIIFNRKTVGMFFSYGGPIEYKYGPSQCSELVQWSATTFDRSREYPYHAQTRLTIPLAASAELLFVSEGVLHEGNFEVFQDDRLEPGGAAVVEIHAFYRHPDADEATVCLIHPSQDVWGMAFFTLLWRPMHFRRRDLYFRAQLRLPPADPATPLMIKNVTTDLPQFSHRLLGLPSAYFESLQLQSSNSPIAADYVKGDNVTFHTSNSGISGTYNVSTSLDLKTSNAPIMVSAILINDNQESTIITLSTRKGPIDGKVFLKSTTPDATKGKFQVNARTSDSLLRLNIVEGPVNSLNLSAHTSESPAEVTLHKNYEGMFDLSTTAFTPEVQWTPLEDPTGRGLRRSLWKQRDPKGVFHGGVGWEQADSRDHRGIVVVPTSNSPVDLMLH